MTGDILKDSAEIFANIQEKAPVVHNISNYITATDCANMTLACGGSPTMADDPDEVEEIAAACAGSVINMGNTAGHYQESMLRTGMVNNKVDHPLVFDPVGAGAAAHRNAVLENLLDKVHFSVIRGNISEVKFVGDKSSKANGVDAAAEDLASEDTIDGIAEYAKKLSERLNTVIAISGPIDVVADANNLLEATAVCISAYGYAGELAYEKVQSTNGGTGSFRMFLMDAMSNMDNETFLQGAKIEEV